MKILFICMFFVFFLSGFSFTKTSKQELTINRIQDLKVKSKKLKVDPIYQAECKKVNLNDFVYLTVEAIRKGDTYFHANQVPNLTDYLIKLETHYDSGLMNQEMIDNILSVLEKNPQKYYEQVDFSLQKVKTQIAEMSRGLLLEVMEYGGNSINLSSFEIKEIDTKALDAERGGGQHDTNGRIGVLLHHKTGVYWLHIDDAVKTNGCWAILPDKNSGMHILRTKSL